MDDSAPPQPCSKRKDVGYKRPPPEHRFKPGQKPPPRKKLRQANFTETLTMILREENRLENGGKPRWMTTAALLVEKAYQLAEQGNPTLSRALVDYLAVSVEAPIPSDEPVILWDPDSDFSGTYHYTRKVPL